MDKRGLAATQVLNNDDLDHFFNLPNTQRFSDIMKKVEHGLIKKGSDILSELSLLVEDDDPVIAQCNKLCADIDNEISMIHNFLSEKYCLKFPQLTSLVPHPIDYARVIQKIGNEVDLTLVDLEGILPSDTIIIMALSVYPASLPLPEDVLGKTIEACDRAILLDASKKKVLTYVKYRMRYIKAMRKLAKKFRFRAPGPRGEGHRQLGQASQGKLRLTVAWIKKIAVIDRTCKIDYKYPSGETTTGLTSSLTVKPAQVDAQAEDARRLGSQIQAIYISES